MSYLLDHRTLAAWRDVPAGGQRETAALALADRMIKYVVLDCVRTKRVTLQADATPNLGKFWLSGACPRLIN